MREKKYMVEIYTELEKDPIRSFFIEYDHAFSYLRRSLEEIWNYPANADGCIYELSLCDSL